MRSSSRRRTTITFGAATLRSKLVHGNSEGKLHVNDLELCEKIGEGAFGAVHMMKEKSTGQTRVVKTVVRPEGWDDQRLKSEAELLQNLDHPHILRIFAWYEEKETINIVMEHCCGGELLDVVRAARGNGEDLCEKWLATAFRQIFEGLVYVHSKGVVHKDLKSDNLLLLESTREYEIILARMPHMVVCDLGIAEVISKGVFGLGASTCKELGGTPITMAPEVWRGSAGAKCDIWSMGVVMFQAFSNRLPFDMLHEPETLERAREAWLALHQKGPDWSVMRSSQSAKHLCQQLLAFKEMMRPTALECLKSQWIVNNGDNGLTQDEIKSVTHALTTWKDKDPWQRAICLKMAVGCTCINKFSRIFSRFDTDQSGALSRSEVVAALQSLGIEKNLAKKISLDLDVNGDNSCEYLEFAAACLSSLQEKFDEMLRCSFLKLDDNHDGVISGAEFETLISELRPIAQAHGFALGNLDQNNDGVISFTEFASYFGRRDTTYASDGIIAALPSKQHVRIYRGTLEDGLVDVHTTGDVNDQRKDSATLPNTQSLDAKAKTRSKMKARRKKVRRQVRVPNEAPLDATTDRILQRLKKRQSTSSQGGSATESSVTETSGTESDAISYSETESTVSESPYGRFCDIDGDEFEASWCERQGLGYVKSAATGIVSI